jgi:hypothetical protein
MINTDKPESAFPSTFKSLHPDEAQVHRWGMTLRDYFAAKAMQSILAREDGRFMTTLEFVGDKAYQYADAMIRAREAS